MRIDTKNDYDAGYIYAWLKSSFGQQIFLANSYGAVIEPLFVGMRQYKHSKRELLNTVLYVVDGGCKWRQLLHDFPAWQAVYGFFRRANEKGLWDKILEHLVKVIRKKAGRNPNPSYALIDSQSVKTAYASEQIGFDGEKTKDRKRRIVADTFGCMLSLKVHKANLHDSRDVYRNSGAA